MYIWVFSDVLSCPRLWMTGVGVGKVKRGRGRLILVPVIAIEFFVITKLAVLYNIVQSCIEVFSFYSLKYVIVMDISK